jgi:hypothetical protein
MDDRYGRTYLHQIISEGFLATTWELLASNHECVDIQENDGLTALQHLQDELNGQATRIE